MSATQSCLPPVGQHRVLGAQRKKRRWAQQNRPHPPQLPLLVPTSSAAGWQLALEL